MLMRFKMPLAIACLIFFGNSAAAKDETFRAMFSLTDGTGKPGDACISRAKNLAGQMESASVTIKKQSHGKNLGPNDLHPREHISVTYNLPNDQMARFYLTCNYGLPLTASQTQSGAACIELNMLAKPENTEPGVQDSFKIRLSDYKGYGGKSGIELLEHMIDQYSKDYEPLPAALTSGCAKIE